MNAALRGKYLFYFQLAGTAPKILPKKVSGTWKLVVLLLVGLEQSKRESRCGGKTDTGWGEEANNNSSNSQDDSMANNEYILVSQDFVTKEMQSNTEGSNSPCGHANSLCIVVTQVWARGDWQEGFKA